MTNILTDVARYSRALKKIGKYKEAEEMTEKVFNAGSPEEAEEIMKSYFQFSKGNEFVTRDDDDDEDDEE